MPYYLAIGVTYERFMDSCPKELEPFEKAHEIKIEEQDYMNWLSNQYTLSAVQVAVERCLAGRKANLEYIEKPILNQIRKENLTEDEKQREVDLFFARENARRVNWRKNRQKKEEKE